MFLYINKLNFFNNMSNICIRPNIKSINRPKHQETNHKPKVVDKDVEHVMNGGDTDDFNPLHIQGGQQTQEELENNAKKKEREYNWVIIGLVIALVIVLCIVAYYFIIVKHNTNFIPSKFMGTNFMSHRYPNQIASNQGKSQHIQQAQYQPRQHPQGQHQHIQQYPQHYQQGNQGQYMQQNPRYHQQHQHHQQHQQHQQNPYYHTENQQKKSETNNETEPLEVSSKYMNDEPSKHDLEKTLKKINQTKQLKPSQNQIKNEIAKTTSDTNLNNIRNINNTNNLSSIDETTDIIDSDKNDNYTNTNRENGKNEENVNSDDTDDELDEKLTKVFYSNLDTGIKNDMSDPADDENE